MEKNQMNTFNWFYHMLASVRLHILAFLGGDILMELLKMDLIACHCKLLSPVSHRIQWLWTPMDARLPLSCVQQTNFIDIQKWSLIMLIDWKLNKTREMIHKTSISKSKNSTVAAQDWNRTTMVENNEHTWLSVEQTTTTATAIWYIAPR